MSPGTSEVSGRSDDSERLPVELPKVSACHVPKATEYNGSLVHRSRFRETFNRK